MRTIGLRGGFVHAAVSASSSGAFVPVRRRTSTRTLINVPRPSTHLSDDTLSQTSRPTSEMWDDTRVHARFSSLAQFHDLTLILTRAGQPAKPKSRYPDRDALASRGQLHPMPSRTKTPELAPWFRRILRAANAVGWGVGCRAGGLKTRSGERKSFVWGPDF